MEKKVRSGVRLGAVAINDSEFFCVAAQPVVNIPWCALREPERNKASKCIKSLSLLTF